MDIVNRAYHFVKQNSVIDHVQSSDDREVGVFMLAHGNHTAWKNK